MEEVKNEKCAELKEPSANLDLPGKLIACANHLGEKVKAKHGEEARLPGSIRLLYSAGAFILEQNKHIRDLEDQLQALTHMLSEYASCETCKEGPAKKCRVRSECGENKTLWSLKDPQA